jgi:hypothetical protein
MQAAQEHQRRLGSAKALPSALATIGGTQVASTIRSSAAPIRVSC